MDIKKKNSKTNKEIVILVSFIEVVISDRLSMLDVSDIAKILRTNIFDKLNKFVGLKSLILGSGSGGWSNMYVEKFATGVKTMKHLVKFSLCYDCTDSIVKILIRNCKRTLRILDVEMSNQVTDEAADWIAQAENIHTLQIYHSGMTELGHGKLLLKLKKLKVLVRGGFLCEALEELSQSVKNPQLEIEEFWSSEDYFFHDNGQMALVQQMCPNMRKIMFQFSKEVMPDVLFLSNFDKLSELHLWVSAIPLTTQILNRSQDIFQGGEFYSDKINLMLTQVGLRLKVLYLIHADEIDERAIKTISRHCNNLETLGLSLCDFIDSVVRDEDEDEDDFYFRRREKEDMELMLELTTLSLVSDCPAKFTMLLLSSALNIEHFKTGQNCPLTDIDILDLFEKNQMKNLKSFNIPASPVLTLSTVELLMTYCEHIE